MITFEEYENALKQRHGERIHNILSHSSVAIAGLGGLGSNIAMYLARAGVGHLHLVDFDKVDITNLNRQQYDIADLGTLKTECLHHMKFTCRIEVEQVMIEYVQF